VADGPGGVEVLGAGLHAVHDGVAAEEPVGAVQGVEALLLGLVPAVGEEAPGGEQRLGAEELLRVPPEGGTGGGAAAAEDALPQAVEVGSSRVDLQACKLEYSIVSPK